ncbi:MAG: hypothetical protein AAF703_07960 [Cyanobacteria bacterium P01_D01_bin.105]
MPDTRPDTWFDAWKTTQAKMSTSLSEAAETAEQLGGLVAAVGTQILTKVSSSAVQTTESVSETAAASAHTALDQTAETVGNTLHPIAENPATDYAAKIPGLSWLTHALGKVDKAKVEAEVAKLKAKHPNESAEALAYRVIVDTTLKAGGIGLVTNIVPPVALWLFAADLAAIATLQSEMLYRIAGIYGFEAHNPARKGEASTVFLLSVGTSTAVKTGLSAVELIPLVGAAVGASSNAGILYSFGIAASEFYKRKRRKENQTGSVS